MHHMIFSYVFMYILTSAITESDALFFRGLWSTFGWVYRSVQLTLHTTIYFCMLYRVILCIIQVKCVSRAVNGATTLVFHNPNPCSHVLDNIRPKYINVLEPFFRESNNSMPLNFLYTFQLNLSFACSNIFVKGCRLFQRLSYQWVL